MDSGDRVLGQYLFIHPSFIVFFYILTDIKDFNNVFQKCQNFAANWRRLGSTLGIAKNAIDIIAENNPRNVTDCMSAVISKWLQRTDTEKGKPKPSWRVLCDAIATIDVAAAEKIAQDIGFTYTGMIYIPVAKIIAVRRTVHIPFDPCNIMQYFFVIENNNNNTNANELRQ